MPSRFFPNQGYGQVVYSLHGHDTTTQQGLRATLAEMIALLGQIEELLRDEDINYFGLDPTGKWRPDQGMFDPWQEDGIAFWAAIAADWGLRKDAMAWFDAIAGLIKRSEKLQSWSESLWECDSSQFGELGAAVCALQDLAFVPVYTRFLRLWDMDHEVNQSETISMIVKKHGLCPETEALLYTRCVDAQGQGGFAELEGAADLFEAKYDNLAEAPLLKRIASAIHAEIYEGRRNEWERYLSKEISRPLRIVDRGYFGRSDSSKLHEAATRIVAELDAAAGPMPWRDFDHDAT